MELIPKWLKPAKASSTVGIYLANNCLVAVDEQFPEHVIQRPITTGEALDLALRAFINEQSWGGRRLHLALSSQWYQYQAIEKPTMPEEDLAQALPWCMRELVNEPVETLLFDYIDLPTGQGNQSRIGVYSSLREPLAELVKAVTPQCEVGTIGVDEIALANLFTEQERILLLYKLPGEELTMAFFHQQQWLYSRALRGFQSIDDEGIPAEQLVFDSLLLELQRSIDYAVGQLKLTAPQRWYLALPAAVTPLLQEQLSLVFGIQAQSLTSASVPAVSLPARGILQEELA